MMKRYQKQPLQPALLLILLYCVCRALTARISQASGLPDFTAACLNFLPVPALLLMLRRRAWFIRFGLVRPRLPAGQLLWYLPLFLLASVNLWNGASGKMSWEMLWAALAMAEAAFCEELLFRGVLFRALLQQGQKHAALLSGVIFGMVHLLNAADFISLLRLAVLAAVLGWLFAVLSERSGSLVPSVLAHAAINVTGLFCRWDAAQEIRLWLVMNAIALLYLLYLGRTERQSA